MPWFAVYRPDGTLASTSSIDPDYAAITRLGWAYKEFNYDVQAPGKRWNESTQDFDDVPIPKDRISVAQFKARFTDAEKDAWFALMRTDDTAGVFNNDLGTMEFVDLDDPYIDRHMGYLVTQRVLTKASTDSNRARAWSP